MKVDVQTNINQVVTGTLNYELDVFWYANVDEKSMRRYNEKIFRNLETNFGKYIDAKARTQKDRYHHVYEWRQVGQKPGRLWRLSKTKSGPSSMRIKYNFVNSTKVADIHPSLQIPGPGGRVVTKSAVFKRKAYVMEEGIPVTIRRKSANFLAIPTRYEFQGKGNITFSKGPVTVRNPGGNNVRYSFARTFSGYFTSGLAIKQLKDSGALQTTARVTKRAGENIPSAIYGATARSNVSRSYIKSLAKANVDRAWSREND